MELLEEQLAASSGRTYLLNQVLSQGDAGAHQKYDEERLHE